jgi:hypothetical protein
MRHNFWWRFLTTLSYTEAMFGWGIPPDEMDCEEPDTGKPRELEVANCHKLTAQ